MTIDMQAKMLRNKSNFYIKPEHLKATKCESVEYIWKTLKNFSFYPRLCMDCL